MEIRAFVDSSLCVGPRQQCCVGAEELIYRAGIGKELIYSLCIGKELIYRALHWKSWAKSCLAPQIASDHCEIRRAPTAEQCMPITQQCVRPGASRVLKAL